MDQANAARRQKTNSQNGITDQQELYPESYSDQSDDEMSSDSEKYQTPI